MRRRSSSVLEHTIRPFADVTTTPPVLQMTHDREPSAHISSHQAQCRELMIQQLFSQSRLKDMC